MVGSSLRVLRFLPPLNLNLSPWYSWKIAESGVNTKNQSINLSSKSKDWLARIHDNVSENGMLRGSVGFKPWEPSQVTRIFRWVADVIVVSYNVNCYCLRFDRVVVPVVIVYIDNHYCLRVFRGVAGVIVDSYTVNPWQSCGSCCYCLHY